MCVCVSSIQDCKMCAPFPLSTSSCESKVTSIITLILLLWLFIELVSLLPQLPTDSTDNNKIYLLYSNHLSESVFLTEDQTKTEGYGRMSQPDPFQELVDNLRRVLLTSTASLVPPITNINYITFSSPSVVTSPMAITALFTGVVEECSGFLLQCSLALEMQPHLYTTDRAKIAFIISLLIGRALQWAETIWTQSGTVTQSVNSFIEHFNKKQKCLADWPVTHPLESNRIISINNLCLLTIMLSNSEPLRDASGWNDRSLLTTFRQGLEPRVRLQLSAYDHSYGLEKFIQLSIRCANRMQSCFMESQNSRHPSRVLVRNSHLIFQLATHPSAMSSA